MTRYAYKVKDINDKTLSGSIDGNSVDEVLEQLAEKDLIPISVEELNFDGSVKDKSFTEKLNDAFMNIGKKVPYKDVVFFTRQLATMMTEGVPLAKALQQLAKNEKPVFKKAIMDVSDDISQGYTFADAISKHPYAFNNLFISVCHAGEITGALDKVLDELADHMENVMAMKMKVKSAMRYPIVIASLITVMMIGILWKLVPTFADIYASLNADLPLPTQMLIYASDALRNNLLICLGIFVGLVILYKYLKTLDPCQQAFDKYLLKFPVFGAIARKSILSTYCRTMGLLMESGTPILKATEICGAVVGNKHYAKAIQTIYSNLRSGDMLSTALEKTGEFPVLVTQLVATGEMSGKVDELLRKAASFYEREIKAVVDSLASIIEPFLIITLGIIVGGVLIALYMPIMMMGQHIQ